MSEVYFVYLGPRLPSYVPCSLLLAKRFSGQNVVFLSHFAHHKKIRGTGVGFVPIEEFYNPETFVALKEKVLFDHDFREGFWVKTFERLFVLQQFMQSSSADSLFHAELDQLLIGTDHLVSKIENTGRQGLFFPFHSQNKAVASVFYVNKMASLDRLLSYAAEGEPFQHEMELLVRFSRDFPDDVIGLPTVGSALPPAEKQNFVFTRESLNSEALGPGVVDAAELGLWIGGRDPRNLPLSTVPATKWMYDNDKAILSRDYFEGLGFKFDPELNKLEVKSKTSQTSVTLYNLHLQSKIHCWIKRRDPLLQAIFASSNVNEPLQVSSARASQIVYHVAIQQGLRQRLRTFARVIAIEFARKLRNLLGR